MENLIHQTLDQQLLHTLGNPDFHQQGIASEAMLTAALWLETHTPTQNGHLDEQTLDLIQTLRTPDNHVNGNWSLPMLQAEERIKSLLVPQIS